jgi:hypothetical protein
MKISLAGVLAIAALALIGRSQPAPPSNVASLVTPSAGAPSTAASTPADERPRQRLDMTQADWDVVYAPYLKCLEKHGIAPRGTEGKKIDKPAQDECDPKLPLPPWELDANNPEAFAFAEKTVECLRGKGVQNVEVSTDTGSGIVGTVIKSEEDIDPNALTGPLKSIDEVMNLTEVCQKDVAGIK